MFAAYTVTFQNFDEGTKLADMIALVSELWIYAEAIGINPLRVSVSITFAWFSKEPKALHAVSDLSDRKLHIFSPVWLCQHKG